MRNLKKFLALVLAMMMAFSLVLTGSAANWNSAAGDFKDNAVATAAFEEGISVVTGMKIFEGDENGDFRPGATITRAEAAAVVYRLVTGDVKDENGKDDSSLWANVAPFKDVTAEKWYAGYVGYLWNAEIIKGVDAEGTYFNPTGNVTGYEVLAMVLRAIGYGKNNEFVGSGWQIRTGQWANKAQLLDNVNTTTYGAGHLSLPARRDVVAEIIFQGANADTVVYTPAFGYETTKLTVGNTNALREQTNSLGYTNFGLTWRYGVVVGNQATGESVTKLSYAINTRDGITNALSPDTYNYSGISVTDRDNNKTFGDDVVYGSLVINFDHDTPRTQFGHANKVWYDASSNTNGVFHSYAWIDKATESKVVYTRYDDDFATDGSAVYAQAKSAGFKVDIDSVFGSDKYDRMGPLNATLDKVSDNRIDTTRNDDMNSEEIHMYALISNSPDKKLDVIISLDAEVVKIYDTNTTATSPRLVMLYGEHGGPAVGRDGTEVLVSNLTNASVQTLGVDVTSWVIDGTKDTDANSNLKSRYETVAVKNGPTATVTYVDETTGEVHLTGSVKLERSRLYDVVRWSDHPAQTGKIGVSFEQHEHLTAGTTYTFVLDEFGHYLGTTDKVDEKFIYATFADHSYGQVGSGELSYLVYGFDENGNAIKDQTLTQLKVGNDAEFYTMDGTQFKRIETARRDYGTTTVGNQVAHGVYRAGYITSDGKWRVNDESTDGRDGGWQWSHTVAKGTAYTNANDWDTEAGTTDWVFTAADAARGFKDVAGDGSLLVTSSTEFYVVSGTGTATMNCKKYTGMTAFLDGATQVIIESQYMDDLNGDGEIDVNDGNWSYDVAYMTDNETYHSVTDDREDQNAMVTKVFMYEKAVKRNSTSTLYYIHDATPTDLRIVKNQDGEYAEYRQYELWQGGTPSFLFLKNEPTSDTFYTLSTDTTVNGVQVWAATAVEFEGSYADGVNSPGSHVGDSRNVCWARQDIEYVSTTNIATARIGNTGYETIYGVLNANVIDLTIKSDRHNDDGCGADHDGHNEIKNVQELFYAISVGYDVEVSIINDGSNVSTIYIVHIDDAPIGRD